MLHERRNLITNQIHFFFSCIESLQYHSILVEVLLYIHALFLNNSITWFHFIFIDMHLKVSSFKFHFHRSSNNTNTNNDNNNK